MAITPRTVVRNPILLIFFSALVVCAGAVLFTCPSKTSCKAYKNTPPPQARTAAVNTVNMATVEAARTVKHGWLGVEIQTLNAERAKWAGVQATQGVLVLGLQDNRPAAHAGFKAYDVIVRFNGKHMRNACQLKKSVAATPAGTKVPVEVIRNGQRLILHPTLADKEGPRGCGAACR